MLSFNRKFGLGAALRQRSIWSGSARAAPGLVVQQLNPYKPRQQTSPANLFVESIRHDGTVYICKMGSALYTSPDLVTFTVRTPYLGGYTLLDVAAIGTTLFVLLSDSGSLRYLTSSNHGVTWSSGYPYLGVSASAVRVTGGVGFCAYFAASSSSSFATVSEAGAVTVRNSPVPGEWVGVASVGGTFVLAGGGNNPVAIYSTDAGASWTVSSSYAVEAAKLPGAPRCIFTVNGRFVAIAWSGATFATIFSVDGIAWQQGASYGRIAEGIGITQIHERGVVLDGHLYISAGGSGRGFILSTPDGVEWRMHSDINASGLAVGLYLRADGTTFVFNTGAETGPALEINPSAQELYYEL